MHLPGHNPGQDKTVPFILFCSFLLTFLVARLLVFLFPNLFLMINGVHIHHFAYGIIIMTLTGIYDLIVDPEKKHLYIVVAFFGIGMGLSYDEFGMWLKLENAYFSRESYDAVLVIALLLLNIIYFQGFWTRNGKKLMSKIG